MYLPHSDGLFLLCWICCYNCLISKSKSESKPKLYYDRQSVSQSVLVSSTHLGPTTNFSHSLFYYFFRQFRVCWCGAPSLTRNWVCSFQFLPGIVSAAIWDSWAHFIASNFETPPTWRARFLYLFPQGTGYSSYTLIYILIYILLHDISTVHICTIHILGPLIS
jgi:hypothetical protein